MNNVSVYNLPMQGKRRTSARSLWYDESLYSCMFSVVRLIGHDFLYDFLVLKNAKLPLCSHGKALRYVADVYGIDPRAKAIVPYVTQGIAP